MPRLAKRKEYSVRLPSGELRHIHRNCTATVGQVGNLEHSNQVISTTSRSRWLGRRQKFEGTAMNPMITLMVVVRVKPGRHPVTPWGKPTKGTNQSKRSLINLL